MDLLQEQFGFRSVAMVCCKVLATSPPGKGARERQAASPPPKHNLIDQTLGAGQ